MFTLLLFTSCQPSQYRDTPDPKLVLGNWQRPQWDYYNGLVFGSDSEVAVLNHIDTVYWFQYRIEGKILVLKTADGKRFESTILKLTLDSLVLDHLLEKSDTLRYARIP